MDRSTRTFARTVILLSIIATACGGDSRVRSGVMGPSQTAGQEGAMVGGMGMGGPMGGHMGGSMTVSSEFDYLTGMIPHHEEAIAAARVLQAGTARSAMRAFAATIIATQSAEVAQMKAWLAAWYPGRDTSVNYQPMMRDLARLTGDALDRAFLEDMIPHHMMAVMMSQQLIMRDLAVHAEPIPFAENIRDTQRSEIQMMQQWLREWFGLRG